MAPEKMHGFDDKDVDHPERASKGGPFRIVVNPLDSRKGFRDHWTMTLKANSTDFESEFDGL